MSCECHCRHWFHEHQGDVLLFKWQSKGTFWLKGVAVPLSSWWVQGTKTLTQFSGGSVFCDSTCWDFRSSLVLSHRPTQHVESRKTVTWRMTQYIVVWRLLGIKLKHGRRLVLEFILLHSKWRMNGWLKEMQINKSCKCKVLCPLCFVNYKPLWSFKYFLHHCTVL